MRLVPGELYHIYNRGNNKERIYYDERHYRFFLAKVGQYLCPHADLLAYCLLPNHFHMLIRATSQSTHIFTPKNDAPSADQPLPLASAAGGLGRDDEFWPSLWWGDFPRSTNCKNF